MNRLPILAVILISVGLLGLALLFYFSTEPTLSLGERIYFTGRGQNGRPIPFRGGPHWLRRHGGSCSSCHGDNGQGGFRIMMTNEEAPSITWEALTEEERDKRGEEEEHPPYNDRTLKRAITDGVEPSGETMDPPMPRWDMNQRELDALVDFLKELD